MDASFVPAYSDLARSYDAALGLASFAHARRLFDRLVRFHRIRFRSAADVGCGTGLFARWLADRAGVPVIGVDRAPAMLSVAAENCAGAPVRLLRQDLRGLALPHPVDLVTANFDVVNHLPTPADLRRAFHRIAANLVRGGHFLFDAITDRDPLGGRSTYVRRLPGGIVQAIRWDARTRTLEGTAVFGRDRARTERHVERAYSLPELELALREAGFAVRGVHDASTGERAGSCPPRVAMVAWKHGTSGVDPREVRHVRSV